MASEIKLKPCPFCGRKAYLKSECRQDTGKVGYWVECDFGFCSVNPSTYISSTKQIAVKAWNRRVAK